MRRVLLATGLAGLSLTAVVGCGGVASADAPDPPSGWRVGPLRSAAVSAPVPTPLPRLDPPAAPSTAGWREVGVFDLRDSVGDRRVRLWCHDGPPGSLYLVGLYRDATGTQVRKDLLRAPGRRFLGVGAATPEAVELHTGLPGTACPLPEWQDGPSHTLTLDGGIPVVRPV